MGKLSNTQVHQVKCFVTLCYNKYRVTTNNKIPKNFYYGSLYKNCFKMSRLQFSHFDIPSVISVAKELLPMLGDDIENIK